MPARTDLLQVGEALAAQARLAVFPPRRVDASTDEPLAVEPDPEQAARMAHAARAALQAAALVDVDPAPLVAALERFGQRFADVHVPDWLDASDPARALDDVGDWVEAWRREVAIAAAVQSGYLALRELAQGLLRDFSAAETETARRIAARIQEGLDGAEQAIAGATQEGAEG